MAEFLNQTVEPFPDLGPNQGFNAMGKPVPCDRQQAGYKDAKEMGCSSERAWAAVHGMSHALAKDKPYTAMEVGMRYLDLTGTYRLMAVLLTDPPQATENEQVALQPVAPKKTPKNKSRKKGKGNAT